jgi:hypothetical protein
MTIREKIIHSFFLAIFISIINWLIIFKFIVEISIFKYFLIEIILILSIKLFTFTKQKLGLR